MPGWENTGESHLETGALACSRLLLHGHNLHDLILEGALQEGLDDLVLFHGEGEEEDLLQTLDLSLQAKEAQLSPLFVPGLY